jgi:hypothetical protein
MTTMTRDVVTPGPFGVPVPVLRTISLPTSGQADVRRLIGAAGGGQ